MFAISFFLNFLFIYLFLLWLNIDDLVSIPLWLDTLNASILQLLCFQLEIPAKPAIDALKKLQSLQRECMCVSV